MNHPELIAEVIAGRLTVEDAARQAHPYAAEHYDARTPEEFAVCAQIRDARRAQDAAAKATRKPAPVEVKLCSCGHTVPRAQVMYTVRGTACPDCYDRLSD